MIGAVRMIFLGQIDLKVRKKMGFEKFTNLYSTGLHQIIAGVCTDFLAPVKHLPGCANI